MNNRKYKFISKGFTGLDNKQIIFSFTDNIINNEDKFRNDYKIASKKKRFLALIQLGLCALALLIGFIYIKLNNPIFFCGFFLICLIDLVVTHFIKKIQNNKENEYLLKQMNCYKIMDYFDMLIKMKAKDIEFIVADTYLKLTYSKDNHKGKYIIDFPINICEENNNDTDKINIEIIENKNDNFAVNIYKNKDSTLKGKYSINKLNDKDQY